MSKFTANQRRFMEWLATDKYMRNPGTQGELAKVLNIRPETLTRWKKLPGFIDAKNDMARSLLRDALSDAMAALRREADKGSYQHIKLLLEMGGELEDVTDERIKIAVSYEND